MNMHLSEISYYCLFSSHIMFLFLLNSDLLLGVNMVEGMSSRKSMSFEDHIESSTFVILTIAPSALQNELSRLRVNTSAMDELVREYCMYRGLIEGGANFTEVAKGSSSDAVAAELSDVLAAGVVNGFKAVGANGPTLEPSPTDMWKSEELGPASVLNGVVLEHQPDVVLEDLSALTGLHDNMDFSPPKGFEDMPNDVIMEEPAAPISEGMNNLYHFYKTLPSYIYTCWHCDIHCVFN